MPDEPACVGHLRNISGTLALVGAAAMPHLIVEHDNTSGFAEVILNFFFPLCSFYRVRR